MYRKKKTSAHWSTTIWKQNFRTVIYVWNELQQWISRMLYLFHFLYGLFKYKNFWGILQISVFCGLSGNYPAFRYISTNKDYRRQRRLRPLENTRPGILHISSIVPISLQGSRKYFLRYHHWSFKYIGDVSHYQR